MLKPYLLQLNDEYSFEFITDFGIRYKVYFLDYSYMFSDYSEITSPVYSLNIDALEGDPDNNRGDNRVGITVAEILNLFFSKIENVIVYAYNI